MPTRIVSYLCLFQLLGLTGAYLFAAWFLKHYEKFSDPWVLATPWGHWMSAVRSGILFLMLIPIGTAAVCMYLAKQHRDFVWLGHDGFWLAVVVTVAVLWFAGATVFASIEGPPMPIRKWGG